MAKFIKWFSLLVLIGATVFLILFLIALHPDEVIQENRLKEPLEQLEEKVPEKNWLNHFSTAQNEGYFYPVNEVYIKVDLDKEVPNNTVYKLSAQKLDPYQLFCLKEELKRHGLKYYLKKDDKALLLLIYSKNIEKLNTLVGVLKNYQILATVEPHREDK